MKLQIKTAGELEALIQALLTAAGHQVYVEGPEQTDQENLLHRATALRDAPKARPVSHYCGKSTYSGPQSWFCACAPKTRCANPRCPHLLKP